jgi:hypothetical protein
MGNKDARKREIKKPKKKVLPKAPPRRDVHQLAAQIVSKPTENR